MTLVLAGISLDACSHAPAEKRRQGGPPQVILTVHGGVEQTVNVELARTEDEQVRGLMFRQSLASGTGMLFLFERSEKHKFWMKNTYIPLDMIFIDERMKVVYVEENAEPLTLEARGPEVDIRYVLEVPGGWARAHGVEQGTLVRFVNVD
jgi:uncharacterized membrane protein (UPF0127 family)